METGIKIVGLTCLVLLMFQRWFWIVAFGAGSVASCIALVTSVMHFQVFGALGYFMLMLVCWLFAKTIAEGYPSAKENRAEEVHLSKGDHPDWSPH